MLTNSTFGHESYLSLIMRYTRLIEQRILECGLNATQLRSMFRLYMYGGQMRIGQIASCLNVSASCVTGAVAQMADEHLVLRVEEGVARKNVRVILTDRGRRQLIETCRTLRPLIAEIRDDSPEELRDYVAQCTLRVADATELFGPAATDDTFEMSEDRVNCALCDEILFTSHLANSIAHDEGMSLLEYRFLLDLNGRLHNTRPSDVARRLGVRRNSIAAIQTDLLERQLILSYRDPLDKRSIQLDLSCDGYAVLRRCAIAMSAGLCTKILPNMTTEDLIKHRYLAKHALSKRAS